MKGHHMAAPILTAERLREVLDYNPDMGVFVWKVRTSTSVRIGDVAGTPTANGYLHIRIDRKHYYGHRLAWLCVYGTWPHGQIDHINGNRLDNRLVNLRDVPQKMNLENQRRAHSNSISGLLGVSPKRNRWKSSIRVAGKEHHIGTYDTPEEAHAAYIEAKRRLHSGCTI